MRNDECYSSAAATNYGHFDETSAQHQMSNEIRHQTSGIRANPGGTQMFNSQVNCTTIKSDITGFNCGE